MFLFIFIQQIILGVPIVFAQTANATSSPQNKVQLGGPNSVGAVLEKDESLKPAIKTDFSWLDEYTDFKEQLEKQTGLAFGFDYNAFVQEATSSMGDKTAASGAFRFYGKWLLLGEDSDGAGGFVYKVENRHTIVTDIPPQSLGGEIGYAGLTALPFSDMGWALTNAYWTQEFSDTNIAIAVGIVDSTDYTDTYAFVNPWTDFVNSAFLNAPTIPFPSQGLGAAVRWNLSDQFYVLGGLANSNGDPTQPWKEFETFFGDHEYFKHIEIGWFSSWNKKFEDNIHLTAWHADGVEKTGARAGKGLALSANHLVGENWLPFARLSWADGGGMPIDQSVSVGVGHFFRSKSDLLSLGLGWGHASSDMSNIENVDQYTVEAFYRFQVLEQLALTPDIQVVVNPVLNPDKKYITIFGLRLRLNF